MTEFRLHDLARPFLSIFAAEFGAGLEITTVAHARSDVVREMEERTACRTSIYRWLSVPLRLSAGDWPDVRGG